MISTTVEEIWKASELLAQIGCDTSLIGASAPGGYYQQKEKYWEIKRRIVGSIFENTTIEQRKDIALEWLKQYFEEVSHD